ncbi:MAG: 3-oxoacyl-ACP reductase FabG [Oscillospiraceae bacterium]|nr:3-oxoacyl-ACP reductase FabG [Oscillospiraceae bacterium]
MTEFRNKAIVTGGSRGIGAAVCRALAAQGKTVTVGYLAAEKRARSLAEEIGGIAVGGDIADPATAEKMLSETGGAGILVCSAGISHIGLFQDMTTAQWRRLFAVNVEGAFNACRAAAPYMIRAGWGRIVLISSMWGLRGASCEAAYSASKAALVGFAKALAKELGPSGITVNCLCPGVIDTEMNSALSEETMAQLKEETPLGRIGTAEDVAAAVSFLVGEGASFITGQVLSVDGGFAV